MQFEMRGSGLRSLTQTILVSLLVFFLVSEVTHAQTDSGAQKGEWVLSWSDEFNGPGHSVDPSKWVFDIGGKEWGNQELEYYTDRPKNVRVEDGNLVIQAQKENYTGADGVTRNYTSGRLTTAGKFRQQY